jgi:hypothetical protein
LAYLVFVLVRWGGMERRVELFAAIRFDWQRHRMPVRALARKYDVHRRTVRQAITSPVPPDRKVPVRSAPVRKAVAGWIDDMLREDQAAPRKQRHTARRIFERLADEHDAQVSYSYVAKYVARRRAEIAAEDRGLDAGLAGLDGFVPQVREPGAEAEVDFGDVSVELAGQLTRCFLFAFRLSCSGKGVHRVYASQAQEAFLEGHVTAFEVTAGCRGGRSGMTTCPRRWPRCWLAAAAPRPPGGWPSGRTTVRGVLLPARPGRRP